MKMFNTYGGVFDYELIIESTPLRVIEEAGISKTIPETRKYLLKGILQKADTVNQNGRIYPKHLLEREVRNYQKFILENRSTGELDHPDSSTVSLKNVSHIVREAKFADNVVVGVVEILNTPSGLILQSLIESGVKLGISSRGVGSVKKQGDFDVVQDDFQLICWDFVSEPSTPGAFMLPEGKVITESTLKTIFNVSDRIDRVLNEILTLGDN
jgi:hypothetical protein